MKNQKLFATLAILVVSIGFRLTAQPIILSPTNGQVFYQGDQIDITWIPRSNAWANVSIGLQDQQTGTFDWVAFLTPNDGAYPWSVGKWGVTDTNFTLSVSDGGNVVNETDVNIVIKNGRRPPTKSQVKSISYVGPYEGYSLYQVSGTCQSGYTNYLEYSTDLASWDRFTDSSICPTNNQLVWYVASAEPKAFFRIATVYEP